MQTVDDKPLAILSSQVMRDDTYKMEQNDNSMIMNNEYDNVELVSKSGDSLLISLVQNYPHLYVKTSKHQKNNSQRENSWEEIAAILEHPASECLKRWTRLRERYSKEKRLYEQSMRNGDVLTHQPCWPHYIEMEFLAEHIVGRRSYKSISSRVKHPRYARTSKNKAPPSPEQASLSSSPAPLTSSLIVASPSSSPSTSTTVVSSPDLPSPLISEHSRIFGNYNQRIKQSSIEESILPETTSTVVSQYPNSNQLFETSEDLFCKYLASELKKMSEDEKKAATRRLMNALFQGNT